ncbi:PIN domain-containing protein [Brevundimonas sp. AJA228-03]|uniref:PIN domain-containing protein n=1 Tax=Brevundimonas sp. AJA228-03 TaxID=2752515 RepID=UPI001AE067B1|nr:PIN domain-containing protein [Brevundimonas sp. AJA228-03]QTN18783.1 PIN domain-containing protein [Brevundimonas sp. AJA228-03]
MISADTNVFAYLYDEDSPQKQAVARATVAALAAKQGIVGLQVVGELNNVLRRKMGKTPSEAAQAGRRLIGAFSVFPPTRQAAVWALEQAGAATLQYWDALLLASARQAGVDTLLTEDLSDGAEINGVLIINPFGEQGLSPRARQVLEI